MPPNKQIFLALDNKTKYEQASAETHSHSPPKYDKVNDFVQCVNKTVNRFIIFPQTIIYLARAEREKKKLVNFQDLHLNLLIYCTIEILALIPLQTIVHVLSLYD